MNTENTGFVVQTTTVDETPLMENDKVFWMVLVEGQQGSTKRHSTYESAATEAERLCRQQSRRAFVLRANEYVTILNPPTKWFSLRESLSDE